VPLLTGEMAALEPDKAKKNIIDIWESIAPNTPEFGAIRYREEIKNRFDRVIFVMEGSDFTEGNLATLSRLVLQLNRNNAQAVSLYVTSSSCERWTREVPSVACKQLPPKADERRDMLAKAFTDFLNGAAQP